jgi:hypothetical protein
MPDASRSLAGGPEPWRAPLAGDLGGAAERIPVVFQLEALTGSPSASRSPNAVRRQIDGTLRRRERHREGEHQEEGPFTDGMMVP